MKIAFTFALMMMVLIVAMTTGSPIADAVTEKQRRDIQAVSQYRMFSYATALYLQANPTYSGTLTWSTLGPATSTPPSMRNAAMPSTFKAVVASRSSYVICGELSETAATALQQFMPQGVRAFIASGDRIVLTDSQSSANTEGAKCS